MALWIQNIQPAPENEPNLYKVEINRDGPMGYFLHVPEEGVAVCLRRAADVIDMIYDGKPKTKHTPVRPPNTADYPSQHREPARATLGPKAGQQGTAVNRLTENFLEELKLPPEWLDWYQSYVSPRFASQPSFAACTELSEMRELEAILVAKRKEVKQRISVASYGSEIQYRRVLRGLTKSISSLRSRIRYHDRKNLPKTEDL